MADEDGWTSLAGGWNWEPVIRRNYGPSGYDRTHMFSAGWNYELPSATARGSESRTRSRISLPVAGRSAYFVAYSGTPFTVTAGILAPGYRQQPDGRPDRTGV